MKPSMREISRATAAQFKITVSELHTSRRLRKFVWPRQIAMALCRELSGRSLPDIGQFFGGRDHTTVMHACREVDREMQTDNVSFRAMMAIAAAASGMSIDRQKLEREWAESLAVGQPMVVVALPGTWQPSETAPPRRIVVPERATIRPPRRVPVTLPSDLKAPSRARLMGARA